MKFPSFRRTPAPSPSPRDIFHHSAFVAGAHASAQDAWIELERPLVVVALNESIEKQLKNPTPPGGILGLPCFSLPIGAEVKSITCSDADIALGWLGVSLIFGALNLFSPYGSVGGASLAPFSVKNDRKDRIAPWILSKTKVDVQVSAAVVNGAYKYNLRPTDAERRLKADWLAWDERRRAAETADRAAKTKAQMKAALALLEGVGTCPPWRELSGRGVEAIFHGFTIACFQEEQVCAIQTRIEPTDRGIGCAELINHFRKVVGMEQQAQRVAAQAAWAAQHRPPSPPKPPRIVRVAYKLDELFKTAFNCPDQSAPVDGPVGPGAAARAAGSWFPPGAVPYGQR